MNYRGRRDSVPSGLRFRAADGSGIEHVWNGGDEYAEVLAKWRAGYRFYDASSGRFLKTPLRRSRAETAAPRKKPTKDYLQEESWRL